MEKKIKIPIPPEKGFLLNPAQLRARKIAEEQQKRYDGIAQKILDIIVQEKVTVVELPAIIAMLTGKVNAKIDKSSIEKILKLDND